jgi:hypothetical protein
MKYRSSLMMRTLDSTVEVGKRLINASQTVILRSGTCCTRYKKRFGGVARLKLACGAIPNITVSIDAFAKIVHPRKQGMQPTGKLQVIDEIL